jgi:hypothetical protein
MQSNRHEYDLNKALLGTRHKWRVPRTLTFGHREKRQINIRVELTRQR